MFGSSSTTRSRASGVVPRADRPGRGLPDTSPPKGADAVVMPTSLGASAAVALDATCESPGRGVPLSAAHRPAPTPVADGVVLGPGQPPPGPEVRAHGPDGGRLRSHPGEHGALRPGERGDGVDEERALTRGSAAPVQPADLDTREDGQLLLLRRVGHLEQRGAPRAG